MKLLAAAVVCAAPAFAASVEEAWAAIVALDAGPQVQSRTVAEARDAAVAHLDRQERALREFVAAHPADARAFEARLRLARLLQIRGDVQDLRKAAAESARILDELEKGATPEQRAEIDFARLSVQMRGLRAPGLAERERLLSSVRKFQRAHPDDRRLGGLFAEVALLFPMQPKTMRELLDTAQASARDEELKARIADDLRRLDLLGEVVTLRGTTTDGKEFDIEQWRGKPVLVVFFALWSVPSVAALDTLKRAAAELPSGRVQIVGVSLDSQPAPLTAMIGAKAIRWPILYDGKGWESPSVRALGINALPTVWLLDKRGRLRSLAALEGTVSQVRQVLGE